MPPTRFETLQDAIRNYGAAAFQNLVRCKGFAEALLAALPDYLGCDPACVRAAPPAGPFDPRKDYGDQAFSYAHRQVIILEPVRFGVVLTVNNAEDSGALWLRTALAVEITGGTFDIYIAQQPVIRAPIDYEDKLEPVLESVYQEFLRRFKIELLEFNDRRFETGIGFMPDSEK